ncbi:MAG: GNAT family N-acetyltransferase [Gemmatimonadetes bacterium]|nr:GNAT family N-acetyltransferase [Gemmatimonadota bacterium]
MLPRRDASPALELLRPATDGDVRALAELWVQAFPGERTVADRERELREGGPHGGLESCWVAEDGPRVVAALRAYALEMYVHGVLFPTMGLAAVAVAPDRRRRGLGRRICTEALSIAGARGDVLSILYPYRASFYRALGYTLAGELHRYRFAPEALPEYEERRFVRAALRVDRESVAELYERVALRTNGMLRRPPKLWAFLDDPRWYAFVYDAGRDGIRGYVIVRHRVGRSPDRRALQVKELVAETGEAYRGLLGWVAAQRDQWPQIIYDALPVERFAERLTHPQTPGTRQVRGLWFETARVLQGPMVRIVSVASALTPLDWPGPERFAVEDAQIPQNEGPWRIGSGRLVRREGRATQAVTVAGEGGPLTVSVAELTARFLEWHAGDPLVVGSRPTHSALPAVLAQADRAPAARPFLLLEVF